jgi:hypothetical protein
MDLAVRKESWWVFEKDNKFSDFVKCGEFLASQKDSAVLLLCNLKDFN